MTEPGGYSTNTEDMRAVHAALLGAFGSADALVDTATADPGSVAIVASFYTNVIEFLHVHHTGEDQLVYPLLEERCPEQAELIRAVNVQHLTLDEPMAAAAKAVDRWQAVPTAASAADAAAALGTVETILRPHLTDEEDDILPIASAYLSEEEWAQLPPHALQTFAADKPWLALGLVRERLTDEQRAVTLAGMPPPLQQLWVNEWEPAFNGFIAQVRDIAPTA